LCICISINVESDEGDSERVKKHRMISIYVGYYYLEHKLLEIIGIYS